MNFDKILKRLVAVERKLAVTEKPLAWMTDDEIIQRIREIYVKDGHPEAATASLEELTQMIDARKASGDPA